MVSAHPRPSETFLLRNDSSAGNRLHPYPQGHASHEALQGDAEDVRHIDSPIINSLALPLVERPMVPPARRHAIRAVVLRNGLAHACKGYAASILGDS